MGKRRSNKPKEVIKKAEPKELKVVFIKNFEGSLNGWKIKVKKGDTLDVLPFKAEWLKKHGAIE